MAPALTADRYTGPRLINIRQNAHDDVPPLVRANPSADRSVCVRSMTRNRGAARVCRVTVATACGNDVNRCPGRRPTRARPDASAEEP